MKNKQAKNDEIIKNTTKEKQTNKTDRQTKRQTNQTSK